jgi:hypothetical protein
MTAPLSSSSCEEGSAASSACAHGVASQKHARRTPMMIRKIVCLPRWYVPRRTHHSGSINRASPGREAACSVRQTMRGALKAPLMHIRMTQSNLVSRRLLVRRGARLESPSLSRRLPTLTATDAQAVVDVLHAGERFNEIFSATFFVSRIHCAR